MINLVEILNQALLSKAEQPSESARLQSSSELLCGEGTSEKSAEQTNYNKRVDEIRKELKRICIEIDSKGVAQCKQTDITCHEIKMLNDKQIKY